ncbi:MAG: hypothetical protein ACYC2R_03105 [Burkholderiales bacterium]
MQAPGLSFDQAPPISVPLRFFLTIPFFILAAAALLLWVGPASLLERRAPATLAIVHLFTLGVLSMAMCGAMMQLLPVVAGARIKYSRLLAWLVHLNLVAGSVSLALGFWQGWERAYLAAAFFLALGFGAFLLAVGAGLWRVAARNATTRAMAFAVPALSVAVALGMGLALYRGGFAIVSYAPLSALHPLWGLAGWTGLLLIGVAYQVVPMFQLTPNYPAPLTRWLVPAVFGLLMLQTLAVAANAPPIAAYAVEAGLAAALAGFALSTLHLHRRRRRRQIDASLLFWRISMLSLIAAIVLWEVARMLPPVWRAKLELSAGLLTIAGFALGAINGMLYKIVPFLIWFHLQSRLLGKRAVPNMKEILPEAWARRQLWLYLAALATLLAALVLPPLVYPAAVLLGANALALWHNLLRAAFRYRRIAHEARQAVSASTR